jgi:hypothetical protein
MPTGAVWPLLVWVALAPAEVRAGCSHLVTSRADRAPTRLPSILQGSPNDRAGATGPILPLPGPAPSGPCRGAWCDDAPTAPAVPAGAVRIRAESWAWHAAAPVLDPTISPRLPAETATLRASHRAGAIFRPPRRGSRA